MVVPSGRDTWAAASPDTMRVGMKLLKDETGIKHVNSKCFRSTLVSEEGGACRTMHRLDRWASHSGFFCRHEKKRGTEERGRLPNSMSVQILKFDVAVFR